MIEYPSLQRKDCMSLSTIKPDEVLGKQKSQIKTRDIMNINDISGSRPELKGFKYQNKQSFANTNQDIIGSKSTSLYDTKIKQNLSLVNKDIEGAKPQCVKFTTNRSNNPLDPIYNLPYQQQRPQSPTKFIKENKFANEEKQLTILQKKSQFKTHQKEDIEGSHPMKLYKTNSFIGNLKVRDINYPESFVTKRNTNPLNPEYQIYGEYGHLVGNIDGCKSKQRHPKDVNKPQLQLITQDIEKCYTNSCYEGFVKNRQVYKEINKTDDIQGAQVGTLKKGMQSKRQTNPCQPDYKMLGETQLQIGYRENHIQNIIKQIKKEQKKTQIF